MTDQNPRYPESNREIIERTFPRIQNLVRAGDPEAAFSDLDHRAPRLRSNHPSHPDAVTYAFKLAPKTGLNMLDGNVSVKIDLLDENHTPLPEDDPTPNLVRRNAARFQEAGFDAELEGNRDTYEVVWDSWRIAPQDHRDDETLQTVADRFVELVEVGHEALADSR